MAAGKQKTKTRRQGAEVLKKSPVSLSDDDENNPQMERNCPRRIGIELQDRQWMWEHDWIVCPDRESTNTLVVVTTAASSFSLQKLLYIRLRDGGEFIRESGCSAPTQLRTRTSWL